MSKKIEKKEVGEVVKLRRGRPLKTKTEVKKKTEKVKKIAVKEVVEEIIRKAPKSLGIEISSSEKCSTDEKKIFSALAFRLESNLWATEEYLRQVGVNRVAPQLVVFPESDLQDWSDVKPGNPQYLIDIVTTYVTGIQVFQHFVEKFELLNFGVMEEGRLPAKFGKLKFLILAHNILTKEHSVPQCFVEIGNLKKGLNFELDNFRQASISYLENVVDLLTDRKDVTKIHSYINNIEGEIKNVAALEVNPFHPIRLKEEQTRIFKSLNVILVKFSETLEDIIGLVD